MEQRGVSGPWAEWKDSSKHCMEVWGLQGGADPGVASRGVAAEDAKAIPKITRLGAKLADVG